MRVRYALLLPMLAVCLCLAAPAMAQSSSGGSMSGIGWQGWGVRAGVTSDPDQGHGGVHFELGEFARDVRFRPTIEIGFGDHATMIQGLAETHYVFSKVQVWKPYVGGGVGLTYINFDHDSHWRDDTETGVALMGIGGVETTLRSATRFFFELKVGFGDEDPDFKLAAGWGWK